MFSYETNTAYFSFDDAIINLTDQSLIQREGDTASIHRIAQLQSGNTMSQEGQLAAFKTAAFLLLEAFPKQANGLSLRSKWSQCTMYIQHILRLVSLYEELKYSPRYPEQFLDFARCLSNAAW